MFYSSKIKLRRLPFLTPIAALYCSWSGGGRKKEVNLTTPKYHLMGTENFEFWKLCLSSHFAKLWTVVVEPTPWTTVRVVASNVGVGRRGRFLEGCDVMAVMTMMLDEDQGLSRNASSVSFGHAEHCFLTVWTPKILCQNLLKMTFLRE